MADLCLKDLLNWSRHVDQGIRQLELLVERNGMSATEVDPDEVVQKLEEIIMDVRTVKTSAQKDVDKLKSMSDELKELIATTETDEMRRIDDELKVMLNMLFPEEASVIVEESLPGVEVQNMDENVDSHMPVAEAVASSLIRNSNTCPEESFTEVEITPGLINKVPKSRLQSDALFASSERCTTSLLRPIRKKTLVFSPSGSGTSRSPTTPTVVLRDCSNWSTVRDEANAKSANVEETIESPEVLERPTRPVLSSVLYGLLD